VLSPETCAEPGKWHTSKAEYLRGFMDACGDPAVKEVVGLFGSQMGKTDAILNLVGYHIELDPCPILLMQPDLNLAETWSKDRLAPMLRDTPSLRGRVRDVRDSDNTILHKGFPGGHITMVGANSTAGLAMRPIRLLIGDEIDEYKPSAGKQGNPLKIAGTRTATFWNAKKVWITSPRNKGSSLSEPIWEKSDKRRFFVPCHECGTEQYLRWPQFQWDKDPTTGEHLTETARYVCEHCGAWWDDLQRWAAISVGHWVATEPFNGVAGFHLPAYAAPWESRSMAVIAGEFAATRHVPRNFQVFVNTILCDWYEEKYQALQTEHVQSRCEPYPEQHGTTLVPKGVGVVVASVDVQDDRLEVQIQGYGERWEQWKLQYHVLDGDPSSLALWDDVWKLLCRPLAGADGLPHYIRAIAIDTGGHHTLRAYEFCRSRLRVTMADGLTSYVFPVKGKGGQGGRFWPKAPTFNNKGKVPLYIVMVDHCKEVLYAQLEKIGNPGAGYIHFPVNVETGLSSTRQFDKRYFDQLTSEKVTDKTSPNGASMRVWELKSDGRRNEALDTSVYAEAALHGLISMGVDVDQKTQLRAELAAKPPGGGEGSLGPQSQPQAAPERRVSKSKFMQRD